MNIKPDDPILTEYALGELDESSQSAVEKTLAKSPEERKRAEEILRTVQQLRRDFEAERCERLSFDQWSSVKAAIKAQETTTVSTEPILAAVFSWRRVLALGSFGAVCLIVFLALPDPSKPPSASQTSNGELEGKDPVIANWNSTGIPPSSRREDPKPNPRAKVSKSAQPEANTVDDSESTGNIDSQSTGGVPSFRQHDPELRNGISEATMPPDMLSRYGLGPSTQNRQSFKQARRVLLNKDPLLDRIQNSFVVVPLTHERIVFEKKKDESPTDYDKILRIDEQGRPMGLAQPDKVVVNIANAVGTRYVVVAIAVKGKEAELVVEMNSKRMELFAVATELLATKTLDDINKTGFRNSLRTELFLRFREVLKSDLIQEVIITQFVIQ